MIAFKLGFETSSPGRGNDARPYIEQVLEFAGPKPTIHFVILTADADPRGEEAHAACVAAKVPPGELALVAFSVHSTGVDQVLVRKEWFDSALATSLAKFPAAPHLLQASAAEPKNQRLQTIQAPPPNVVQSVAEPSIPPLGPRIRTPPSAEEVEAEIREVTATFLPLASLWWSRSSLSPWPAPTYPTSPASSPLLRSKCKPFQTTPTWTGRTSSGRSRTSRALR